MRIVKYPQTGTHDPREDGGSLRSFAQNGSGVRSRPWAIANRVAAVPAGRIGGRRGVSTKAIVGHGRDCPASTAPVHPRPYRWQIRHEALIEDLCHLEVFQPGRRRPRSAPIAAPIFHREEFASSIIFAEEPHVVARRAAVSNQITASSC